MNFVKANPKTNTNAKKALPTAKVSNAFLVKIIKLYPKAT